MREIEFLKALEDALRVLPASQIQDIVAEYRSHFFEAKERGKQEEDIAASLGDPRTIAQTYIADYHLIQWRNPEAGQGVGKSLYHLLRGILVMISLLFFNFFFMLWPLLFVFLMVSFGWLLVSAFTVASFAVSLASLFGGLPELVLAQSSTTYAIFFYAFGGTLLGVLLLMGLFALSRILTSGVLRYIKLNLTLISPLNERPAP